YQQYNSFPLTF
nr:immunoglobulin light chain junction region [Macaca mulatta]